MPTFKIDGKIIRIDENGQDKLYDEDFYNIQKEYESKLVDDELEEWVKGLSK
jgi:hypothetical protein